MRRLKIACLLALIALLSISTADGQRDPSRRPSSVVVLVIRPLGFEPDQITLPAGKIFFSVHNRTGMPNVNLQLDRPGAGALRSVALRRSTLAWRETVELTPGMYALSVIDNPKWACRIRVTP